MILIVTNRKGGSGKTAIATSVAMHYAEEGRGLLIDLDPQGDASATLAVNDTGADLADALLGRRPPDSAIRDTQWGVAVAAAGEALAYVHEQVSPGAVGRMVGELWPEHYPWVVIDCPPGVTPLVLSAWRACPAAVGLVPVNGPQALRAVNRLRNGWEDVGMDPDRIRVVLTRHDSRRVLDRAVERQARKTYGVGVLQTRVRESVVVGESAAYRQPLLAYAADHPISDDMRNVAREVFDG